MKSIKYVVICAAVIALAGTLPATAGEGVSVGDTAPGFTLADTAGAEVSLSDYAGKVVVLEWLNPDCPYVKRHYKAGTMRDLANK
jgi:hypothetical protein